MLTDISRLTESPGEMKRRPDGAQYHDGESIITHLNYSLHPWGWDWSELENGIDTETDEAWVLGQLTARFIVEGPDGGEQEHVTVKTERGWQKTNRLRDGSAKSPGDDKKGAATDALKRAARLLGVGLDAWAKDGSAPQRERKQTAPPSRAATPIRMTPEGNAAAQLTGAPPTPTRCNKQGFTVAWHTAVKRTRFDDDDTRHKFIAYHTQGKYDSLSKFLDDATHEQADALMRAISARIQAEAAKASEVTPREPALAV